MLYYTIFPAKIQGFRSQNSTFFEEQVIVGITKDFHSFHVALFADSEISEGHELRLQLVYSRQIMSVDGVVRNRVSLNSASSSACTSEGRRPYPVDFSCRCEYNDFSTQAGTVFLNSLMVFLQDASFSIFVPRTRSS